MFLPIKFVLPYYYYTLLKKKSWYLTTFSKKKDCYLIFYKRWRDHIKLTEDTISVYLNNQTR